MTLPCSCSTNPRPTSMCSPRKRSATSWSNRRGGASASSSRPTCCTTPSGCATASRFSTRARSSQADPPPRSAGTNATWRTHSWSWWVRSRESHMDRLSQGDDRDPARPKDAHRDRAGRIRHPARPDRHLADLDEDRYPGLHDRLHGRCSDRPRRAASATNLKLVPVADPASAAKKQVDIGVAFKPGELDVYYDPSRQGAQIAQTRLE